MNATTLISLPLPLLLLLCRTGVGSSFGFVIPFPVVEVQQVLHGQSGRSRSLNRADPHHISRPAYTPVKSKFILRSLSSRLLPSRSTPQDLSLDVDDPRSSPSFSGRNASSPSPLDIPMGSGTDLDMIVDIETLDPGTLDRMDSNSVPVISEDTTCGISLTKMKDDSSESPVQRAESISSDISAMGLNETGNDSAPASEISMARSVSICASPSVSTSAGGSDKRFFISSPGGRIAPDTGLSLSRGLTSASRTASQVSFSPLGVEIAGAIRSASEKTEKKMSFLLVDGETVGQPHVQSTVLFSSSHHRLLYTLSLQTRTPMIDLAICECP